MTKKNSNKGWTRIKLKQFQLKHYISVYIIAIVMVVFGIVSAMGGLPASTQYLFEKIGISITLAVSLSFVVGFLGELSLGHAGFMCVGAYLGGKASVLLAPILGNGLLALIISMIIGGCVAAIFGVIIGLPALRLKGDYLAIVTLAFGEIVKSIFQNSKPETFGGALGLDTPRFNKNYLFIVAFIVVIITILTIQHINRSRHGRAITAIRDNEIAARAMGINVTNYKLVVFTVSAFFAGIAGVLYSYSNYTIQSSKFGYNYSIEILVMVVLGGMGSINGSVIAAALITFLNLKLATVLTGDLAVLQNLVYALILIIIVVYNNAPSLKGFREKYSLKIIIADFLHKEKNPAKISDDEAKWGRIPTKIDMDEVVSAKVGLLSEDDGSENDDGKEDN